MKKKRIFPLIFLLSGLIFCSAINNVSAQCTESFDGVTAPALPAGWSAVTLTDCTGSNPWVTSTATPNSAPNSAFVNAPACISDEVLISRPYSIATASAQLTFRRKHNLELNWDGLVLEISIDGGSFVDILAAGGSFTTGEYTVQLNSGFGNPLSGRQAWTGSTSNAFITTTVNLPASANGRIVIFRWRRGTDSSNSDTGVYIDNVSLTGCSTSSCAENFDSLTVPALPSGWIAATALDCVNSNPWLTVSSTFDSSPNSIFVNDPDCISDEYLYSKLFPIISTTAQITFRRNNNLELNYDGMVLEISIGGAPFTDILLAGCTFVSGGYSNVIISDCCGNPLSGVHAWTGNSAGWITTTINLPATASGKNIILRWRRGSDNSQSGTGAYIDGLSITGSLCNTACGTNITLTPSAGSLCSSNQIVLTASVAGAVYEWYRNDVKINGITGNTYTATTAGIYYVRALISGCLVTSNVAFLETVPVVPTSSGAGVYCSGSSVSIGVAVTEYDQQYTWKKNGTIMYGPVRGTGGALSYNFIMGAGSAGDYVVESAKPGCTTVVSNVVSVRLPELVTGLTTVKVCPQQATIKWNHLTQEFITQNYEYQISQSATPPSSGIQTIDSFAIVTVNPSTLYYFYVRYKCSASGTVNWTSISFTTPAITNTITLSPSSGTVCNNLLTLTASGSGAGSYQWYKDNILINGETGAFYNASSGGTYTVKSVVNGCTIVSNNSVISTATITHPNLDLGTFAILSRVYCDSTPVEIRINNSELSQQYTWYHNSNYAYGPIGGNGGNQSLPVAMSVANEGEWTVTSTKSGCGNETSNTVYTKLARVTGLFTNAICSNQVSFTWSSIEPGENYQYVVDQDSTPPSNPGNSGITSSTSATVSSLLPTTTYYIHIRAASGPDYTTFCAKWTKLLFSTPASNPILEWTGDINSSWFNTSNWTCGQVPLSTSEVIINGGKPNYPTVSSNITIKKLTVNSGATINIEPGVKLTVTH